MIIKVNNRLLEVDGSHVLLHELRAAGIDVPSMCYAEGAKHQASCMVCMVKNVQTGQMIPSCETMPQEGMEIVTDSEEVQELRRMGLELLLSDHKARCGVCDGKAKCRLRELAIQMKAKWVRYSGPSSSVEEETIRVNGRLFFEPAKCIRCGLCVYNTEDGFTFVKRGFDMQVMIPDECRAHVDERVAELCPTGALYPQPSALSPQPSFEI